MSSLLRPRIEAFMLAAADGYRFCLLHHPSPKVEFRGGIVVAHPFAEEMNKSRRATAVAARRLAADGWAVLQIDLAGCGDSSGDIANVRWQDWLDDLTRAVEWLEARDTRVRVLWGVRLGALLAAAAAVRMRPVPDLLLWQPVLNGKAHLTQFLRLKAFEEMLVQSGQHGATSALRSALASGNVVDVAGYRLGPALAAAIDAADLDLPRDYRGQILWLETGRTDQAELAPASAKHVDALVAAGQRVMARAVIGPSFWQTVEIEESPALVEETAILLRSAVAPLERVSP